MNKETDVILMVICGTIFIALVVLGFMISDDVRANKICHKNGWQYSISTPTPKFVGPFIDNYKCVNETIVGWQQVRIYSDKTFQVKLYNQNPGEIT